MASRTSLLLTLAVVMCGLKLAASVATYDPRKPAFSDTQSYKITFSASGTVTNTTGAITRVPVSPFNSSTVTIRTMTILPCGSSSIHIHPRGNEHGFIVSGAVEVGTFLEEGIFLPVQVNAGEGFVVPVGAVHYVRNLDNCANTTVLFIFDHPDPGTVYMNAALTKMPSDVVKSNFAAARPNFPFPTNATGTSVKIRGCKCTRS